MTPVNFPAGIGAALAAELTRQGVEWHTHNGQLEVSDEALFTSIAGAFDQVAGERPAVVARIKDEAQRRIYLVAPQWKQANLTARGVELTMRGTPLNADEQAEVAAGQAIWSRIKALRLASNAIEARLATITDRDAVTSFDVIAAAEWPE